MEQLPNSNKYATSDLDPMMAPPANSAKRQHLLNTAKYWLGAGVLFMAMSFSATFFFSGNGLSFTTGCMYLLTTLGTACILKALVNVFN
jgi:hypothetical protein